MLLQVQHLSSKTAILVFANSAQAELARKPMAKGELLFNALTQQTITKVRKTGLPYIHISENEQQGTTFGERFSNAIQSVFSQGYDRIITIGNDTPQLKTQDLKAACSALEAGKTVLGPSLDGGFYLLGLHKKDFNATLFSRLPWQRASLFLEISAVFSRDALGLYQLPVLGDIDRLEDAKHFSGFRRSVAASLLHILALVIAIHQCVSFYFNTIFTTVSRQLPHNKGSPLVVHS